MINVERLKSLTWVQARLALLRSCITFLDAGCERDDGSQRNSKAAFLGSHVKGVFVFFIIFVLIDQNRLFHLVVIFFFLQPFPCRSDILFVLRLDCCILAHCLIVGRLQLTEFMFGAGRICQ